MLFGRLRMATIRRWMDLLKLTRFSLSQNGSRFFFYFYFIFSGRRPDPGRLASSRPDQVITKHGRSNKVTGRPLITTRGQGVNSGQSEVLFYVGSGTQLVSPFCCFFFSPTVFGQKKNFMMVRSVGKKRKICEKTKIFFVVGSGGGHLFRIDSTPQRSTNHFTGQTHAASLCCSQLSSSCS